MSTVSLPNPPCPGDRLSRSTACNVNVGRHERLISVIAAIGLFSLSSNRERVSRLLCLATSAGLLYRGLTGKCTLYEAVGVNTAYAHSHPNAAVRNKSGVHVIQAMTISQPVERLYEVWKDFANLPRYLSHVESVKILDERQSRWTIKSPHGEVQWDATSIEDKKNESISWKTLGKSEVSSAGSVRFKALPALGVTELVVNLRYDAVGDSIMSWVSSFFGEAAESTIREDLRRFKQLLETGEIATIEGQPTGRR